MAIYLIAERWLQQSLYYLSRQSEERSMFHVVLSNRARKEKEQISSLAVEEVLTALGQDPLPAKRYDVKKLQGLRDSFRIRLGEIRIIYTVIWQDRTVMVSRIAMRETAYG